MAYIDQAQSPPDPRSIALVGGIHVALAAALVFGLAGPIGNILADPHIDTWDIPKPKPVPPPPPEPTTDAKVETTISRPVIGPTPPVDLTKDVNFGVVDVDLPPLDKVLTGPLTGIGDGTNIGPKPKLPAKPATVSRASAPTAKNDSRTWATTQDYPRADLREGNEGVTRYVLSVAANGRVSGCQITTSSGHVSLDKAACDLVSRRARFDPAKDTSGATVTGSYKSSIRWVIPNKPR